MKIHNSIFLIVFLALSFGMLSCSSEKSEKSNTELSKPTPKPTDPLAGNFKLSLYISANATTVKPADSWVMDTTGTIIINTSGRPGRSTLLSQNAVATLDPPDMDSLRLLIRNGKLYGIDSADLTEKCGSAEYYTIRIVPLAPVPYLSVTMDSCAADYNLLLEPQRKYFRQFIDWWERMRVKYRPNIQ